MTEKTLHIGFDDTDSTTKGCTTYVAALLVERLLRLGVRFIDYPNLIRLNPNVPWKTRGNGALCLRISCVKEAEDEVKETVIRAIEEESDFESRGTDPGIVFCGKVRIPREVKEFASKAIAGVVTLKEAARLLRKHGGEAIGFKEGRGIIGGLAAIGETLERDHTYEIIAYRTLENRGKKRMVDENSIFEMDKSTAPYTFNNVDSKKRRVIITPRGPDPILFGIRGESPGILKSAFEMVKPLEPIERWVIFRTNQGTDAHLRRVESLSSIKPYSSAIVKGIVATSPRIIPRRHVIFSIEDTSGEVDCAGYEPTGILSKTVSKLMIGDSVEVYGGVRPPSHEHPLTLNLEKIRILELTPKIAYQNPVCSECGKRLKSMGRDKGFRCENCGLRYRDMKKIEARLTRDLKIGLYLASTRSQRHLTKPHRRYGMEKHDKRHRHLGNDWHFP